MFTYRPIDLKAGVKQCNGNNKEFKEMLEDFDSLSFYKIMLELHQNMLDMDIVRIGTNASTLKKAFG